MTDHRISVCSVGEIGAFFVQCSCGKHLLSENLADLDWLIELAHEHIEAAERAEPACVEGRPVHGREVQTYPAGGYVVEPGVTSNDDLVDLSDTF